MPGRKRPREAPRIRSTIAVLFAVGAFAQTSISAIAVRPGGNGTMHLGPAPPFRATAGAPYSGDQVNETVQTLVDGTHIPRTMPATKIYRDSSGRTRTKRPMFGGPVGLGPNVADAPIIIEITDIEITDPVAACKYTLDTQNKVAHRQEFGAARPANITAAMVGGGGRGGSTSGIVRASGDFGNLPVTTMATTTWPVGAQGNDRAITTTR